MAFGIASIFQKLESKNHLQKYWWVVGVYLLASSLLQDYIYHGPLNSLAKPSFYRVQSWEKDAHALIKQIPPGVDISTQNSLLPHLSQRDRFYLLPETGGSELVAVDLEDGPNKFSPLTQSEMSTLVNNLIQSGKYRIIWQQNKSMLLQKSAL